MSEGNIYLKNLKRIEFIVTNDCTGKCIHCSQGTNVSNGVHIDKKVAYNVVCDIASEYEIKSVMTFGGESLLYPECVCSIHSAATMNRIPHRQLITNGFFTDNTEKIKYVSLMLKESGVNDILLSVDAFHQQSIPVDVVKIFATEILKTGISIRTNPAWLCSKDDANEYNLKTTRIIEDFKKEGIEASSGNIVFPYGNALKYLSKYFKGNEVANPYIEDPFDVKTISVEPDGTLFNGNVYKENAVEIIKRYKPNDII